MARQRRATTATGTTHGTCTVVLFLFPPSCHVLQAMNVAIQSRARSIGDFDCF